MLKFFARQPARPPDWLSDPTLDIQVFDPAVPTDQSWYIDQQSVFLGTDSEGLLFRRVAQIVMQYQYYPETILRASGRHQQEQRSLQPGDLILQEANWLGGLLRSYTLVRVVSLIVESQRRGFTYFTTEHHWFEGEYTASVVQKKNGEVVFLTHAVSRPNQKLPIVLHPLARAYQKLAQRKAAQNLLKKIHQLKQGENG